MNAKNIINLEIVALENEAWNLAQMLNKKIKRGEIMAMSANELRGFITELQGELINESYKHTSHNFRPVSFNRELVLWSDTANGLKRTVVVNHNGKYMALGDCQEAVNKALKALRRRKSR